MAIRPQLIIPLNKIGLCAANNVSRRIGLLGGTFNPPHGGHLHLSHIALRMLKLDAVWWLVTPGNPLKPNPPPPIEDRLLLAHQITRHEPRILATDLEQQMGTRYSIDTVAAVQHHFPRDQFVWLCGTDIAHEIYRWRRWRELTRRVSFACIARPPSQRVIGGNPIRMMPRDRQVILSAPIDCPLDPPRWFWILNTPRANTSSSSIRARYVK